MKLHQQGPVTDCQLDQQLHLCHMQCAVHVTPNNATPLATFTSPVHQCRWSERRAITQMLQAHTP